MEKEVMWNILIENELYKILEFAKDKEEREELIKNYSEENEIPINFIKEKIQKMKDDKRKREERDEER